MAWMALQVIMINYIVSANYIALKFIILYNDHHGYNACIDLLYGINAYVLLYKML